MSDSKEIKTEAAAAVKAPKVPKEPRLPRAPTKQSFSKKRAFFTDTSARHYFRHTTKLSEYFNARVAGSGAEPSNAGESKTSTQVFWVVLTGEQTVPLAGTKVSVITKLADEKVAGSLNETAEMTFIDSSAGKEVVKNRKTGWVIAQGPKELFQLFENQRLKSVADQKVTRLSSAKQAKAVKLDKVAKKAKTQADAAAAKVAVAGSSAPAPVSQPVAV